MPLESASCILVLPMQHCYLVLLYLILIRPPRVQRSTVNLNAYDSSSDIFFFFQHNDTFLKLLEWVTWNPTESLHFISMACSVFLFLFFFGVVCFW